LCNVLTVYQLQKTLAGANIRVNAFYFKKNTNTPKKSGTRLANLAFVLFGWQDLLFFKGFLSRGLSRRVKGVKPSANRNEELTTLIHLIFRLSIF
jgi:hypothetical protein